MKKIILSAVFLLLIADSFCQQSNPSQNIPRDEYLKKSKHQKTAAWILLGAGTLSAGLLAGVETNPNSIVGGEDNRSTGFLIAGLTAIGASVPLFISAGRNKKKGLGVTASFKNEPVQLIKAGYRGLQSYSALSVKMNFK